MRLIINTASADRGGSIQVALSFLNECRGIPEHDYFVFLSPNLQRQLDVSDFPDNFCFYKMEERPATKVFSFSPMGRLFKKLEAEIRPDCVFTTSGPAYWKPEAPHLIGYNLPHYIYRDSPFWKTVGRIEKWKFNLKGILIRWFYRRDASHYVCQTDDVCQRLLAYLQCGQAYTVSNTCSRVYYEPQEFAPRLPARKENEFRLLTVSALYTHKNLEIIRNVVDELRRRGHTHVRFVLTIPKGDYQRLFGARYSENVVTVGPVPPVECPSLYRECDAMFLPTLLECFSASYPEAMIMEKPILTSDLGFARTVCKDAAIYYDPLNAYEIADRIVNLMQDRTQYDRLIELGTQRLTSFNSARQRAEAFLSHCESLVAGSQP